MDVELRRAGPNPNITSTSLQRHDVSDLGEAMRTTVWLSIEIQLRLTARRIRMLNPPNHTASRTEETYRLKLTRTVIPRLQS